MEMIEPGPYDWDEHEPNAWRVPYGSRDEAVAFVLAPVRSWEHRTRIEMEAHDPYMWEHNFLGSESLVGQLSLAALRSPDGSTHRHYKGRGIVVDERGNSLWLGGCTDCLRLLDWIWEAYRVRLANRVEAAYYSGGLREALGLCDDLAARFDLRHLDFGVRPIVRGLFVSGEPIPRKPDLYPCDFAFNGYSEEAWGRFVSAIDSAKGQARRLDLNRPFVGCGELPSEPVAIEFNPSLGEPWYDPADDEPEPPVGGPEPDEEKVRHLITEAQRHLYAAQGVRSAATWRRPTTGARGQADSRTLTPSRRGTPSATG